MSVSTIIKLREQESISSGVNGSYSIPLSESLLLEEGDQVLVKSVFIDASVESFVTLPTDTTITMTTAKYYTNGFNASTTAAAADYSNPFKAQAYPYDQQMTAGQVNTQHYNMFWSPVEALLPNPTVGPPIPAGTASYMPTDLCRYWQCEEVGTVNGDFVLKGLTMNFIKGMHWYGPVCFQLTYWTTINGVGQQASKNFQIERQRYKDHKDGYFFQMDLYMSQWPGKPAYYVEVGRWVDPDTGQPDPNLAYFGSASNTEMWKLSDNTNQGGFSGDYVARLITEDLTFVIPEGKYAPAQIAQIVTDNMSGLQGTNNGKVGNDYTKGEFFVNSPMLSSKSQAYWKKNNTGGTINKWEADKGDQNVILYIKEMKLPIKDTDYVMIGSNFKPSDVFDATQDNFIGTNSAFLNYDPVLNKLNFDAIHFPVYIAQPSGNTFEPGIAYSPNAPPFLHEPVTSYSGVGFTDLQPGWFWSQLGFTQDNTVTATLDSGVLAYVPDPTFRDGNGFQDRSIHVINVNGKIGQNITAQFAGLDMVVDKTADWMQPIENPIGIITSTTDPIYAGREFGSSIEDNGYYLIDISPKFPQKLVGSANEPGSSTSNSIQSIVGKYYTQGNFLQDDGSGSISYTHVGVPQMINQLDVRVLNADGTVPARTDIGDNNSVFVEIIKAFK